MIKLKVETSIMNKSGKIVFGSAISLALLYCAWNKSQTPVIARVASVNCPVKGISTVITDGPDGPLYFQNTPDLVYGKEQVDVDIICKQVKPGNLYFFRRAWKFHDLRSNFPNIISEPQEIPVRGADYAP